MSAVACPKCSVVAHQSFDGGWNFNPNSECVDLSGTEWGAKGELEWCPALAEAMPDEIFWPGRSHRDHVLEVTREAQAKAGNDT